MTVAAAAAKAGPYTGNDVTTTFAFEFKVFADSDIRVVKTTIASGLEEDFVLNTDYTVIRNVNQDTSPGGTVTYRVSGVATALPSTLKLTIVGNYSYEQPTDIPNGGSFLAQVVENALDRNTMLIKQVREAVSRSLQVSVSTPEDVNVELPAPVANKLIGWDENAENLQNFDASTLASIVAYGTAMADQFTGDGATLTFTLTSAPVALANLDVSIDGISQLPTTDYTVSGTTLTFAVAPPNLSKILARYMQALPQTYSDLNATINSLDSAKVSYAQTTLESTDGVNPPNKYVRPYEWLRYGTNTTPGTTDMSGPINNANAAAYSGETDGTNFSTFGSAGNYGIDAQITVRYGVTFNGEGERSTSLTALSAFANIATSGMVRIGTGAGPVFGSRVRNMMLQAASRAGSIGVFSSDIQSGGCENVTVNNFLGTGFKFDPAGTGFGSVNGYWLHQCQAFKANSGGTSGTGISAKDGTFYALHTLNQVYGNPSNPLATGYSFTNIPVALVASNVDGAMTTGVDFGTAAQGVMHGFTSNGATTAVNISSALAVTITGLYMPAGTTAVNDAGNGGGVAKTIVQSAVPLYWRGQYYAHGDYLKIWGGLTCANADFSGITSFGLNSTGFAIVNGSTINADATVKIVAPAGAVTGIILAAGTKPGQMLRIINQSGFTVTMAAAGTSRVADGTSSVIPALRAAVFTWNDATSLWYRD